MHEGTRWYCTAPTPGGKDLRHTGSDEFYISYFFLMIICLAIVHVQQLKSLFWCLCGYASMTVNEPLDS